VIPLIDALNAAIVSKKVAFFQESKVEMVPAGFSVQWPQSQAAVRTLTLIGPDFTAVANRMEAFAVFFVSGVADEMVAFSAVGRTYCQSTRKLLPALLLLARLPGGSYRNVLRLFRLWDARLQVDQLQRAQQELESKLGTIQTTAIPPLGTTDES
jgi:hypothetical protein